MALPTTGISTSLVAQTIGAGSNDVGTLCRHSTINPYSKQKPVANPSPAPAGNWWKGVYATESAYNGDCGIRKPSPITISSWEMDDIVPILSTLNTSAWSVRRPQGGQNEPYRLGDFRAYEHGAVPFILAPTLPATRSFDSDYNLVINFDLNPGTINNLKATDFFGAGTEALNLNEWGLWGFFFEKDHRSTQDVYVPDENLTPILDSNGNVQSSTLTFVGLGGITYRDYELHLMLRNTIDGTKYIPLPKLPSNPTLYNNFPHIMNVYPIVNAYDAGAGIYDIYSGVQFLPFLSATGSELRTISQVVEEYGGSSIMSNADREIAIRLDLTNMSQNVFTLYNGDITLYRYPDSSGYIGGTIIPGLYDVAGNGGVGNSISSINISPGQTKTIYIAVTSNFFTGVNNGEQVKFEINRGKYVLFKGTVRYYFNRLPLGWY